MENKDKTTSYFTFGQVHVKNLNGNVIDKNCVVKITDEDPRKIMFEFFGDKWAMEYSSQPDMNFFPRGVFNLNTGDWE